MGLALGARHVQGLFLLPVTLERGWSREFFALALAVQNLAWGLAQPLTGMVADRFGARGVVLSGLALYGVGLLGMAYASTPALYLLAAGVAIGLALSGTAFGVIYAAVSRLVEPAQRPWALGMAGAIGGLGQFAMVPAIQELIVAWGWRAALAALALLAFAAVPLALRLHDRPAGASTPAPAGAPAHPMAGAVRDALAHRGFWLLNLGFLACGFQLAFIATHLPAYLIDRGLGPGAGVGALATIALANIFGTYACGVLGGRYRPRTLLALIYLARALAIGLFVTLPVQPATVYAFAAVMGLLWLGTVPLTNAVLSRVFGVRYLATLFGFVFLGHQLGSFLGVWLGGRVYDATGSYDAIWLGAIALGLGAAALHWPIDDRPAHPAEAPPQVAR
jgi:MFS family permease